MQLFEMNAHGDIWQEPDLFDQPAEPVPHTRAGSSATFTGTTWRYCSCGAEFVGAPDKTFAERDQHIAEAVTA